MRRLFIDNDGVCKFEPTYIWEEVTITELSEALQSLKKIPWSRDFHVEIILSDGNPHSADAIKKRIEILKE